jgi:DNA repair exonuclease SbcCD ATPase subunit
VDGQRLGAGGLHGRLTEELSQARAELTEAEDRLFDQTLAGEARRQVADRIRQANDLVDEMNALLQRVQTASKMRVKLRWQVSDDLPAGTREARNLILRSPESLSEGDRAGLHAFFRERVEEVRQADTAAGWHDQLLDVLDYRRWHTFVVQVDKGDGAWQAVTKRTHGQLSGGERAIALHLPLFAAAAAHYAGADGAPRLILLDEVFVGVDAGNRGQLLDLIVRLDLDAVMTSDHEWCTYTELDGIAVHQLITGTDGDDAVTTARFVWDGARLQPIHALEVTLPLGLEDD